MMKMKIFFERSIVDPNLVLASMTLEVDASSFAYSIYYTTEMSDV